MLPAYLLQDGSLVKDWQVINDDRPKYWVSCASNMFTSACQYNTNPQASSIGITCFSNYNRGYTFNSGSSPEYIDIHGGFKPTETFPGCNILSCGYLFCGSTAKYISFVDGCLYLTLENGCLYWGCLYCNNGTSFYYYCNFGAGNYTLYCCQFIDISQHLKKVTIGKGTLCSILCLDYYTGNIISDTICCNYTNYWCNVSLTINSCAPADSVMGFNSKICKWYGFASCCSCTSQNIGVIIEGDMCLCACCDIFDNCCLTSVTKIWQVPKSILYSNGICSFDSFNFYNCIHNINDFYMINATHPTLYNTCCSPTTGDTYRHSSILLNKNTNTIYGITHKCACTIQNLCYIDTFRTPVYATLTTRNTVIVIQTCSNLINFYEYTCNLTPITSCCFGISITFSTNCFGFTYKYDDVDDAILIGIFDTNYIKNGCSSQLMKLPSCTGCIVNKIKCNFGCTNSTCCSRILCYYMFYNNNAPEVCGCSPCIITCSLPCSNYISGTAGCYCGYISQCCICSFTTIRFSLSKSCTLSASRYCFFPIQGTVEGYCYMNNSKTSIGGYYGSICRPRYTVYLPF